MRPSDTPDPSGAPLTVFYNAECPVCRREIDHYRRYAAARGLPLRWADVAADPGALASRGIDPETQRRRLHALTPDGDLVAGVDAFDLMWRRMPRYRWLAAVLRPRWVRAGARLAYDKGLAPALHRLDRDRRHRRRSGTLPHEDQN